jgi:acyl carrier protein
VKLRAVLRAACLFRQVEKQAEKSPPLSSRDNLEAKMAAGRDVTAEVKRIIKEQLDVDESDIKPESVFIDDLGADSLGLVELVLAFEEAFEIDIPDEDTEQIRTVQDAVKYIEQHSST